MALCLLGHHLRVRFSVLKLRHFISPSFRLVTWLQGPKHEVLLIFRIDKVTMWASYQREGTTSTLLWLRWGGWLLINFSSFIEIPRMFNFVLILISSARVLHWTLWVIRSKRSFFPIIKLRMEMWHIKAILTAFTCPASAKWIMSLPGNWPEPESLQIHVRRHWTTNH